MTLLILAAVLVIALLIGVPIAYSLLLSVVVTVLITAPGITLGMISQTLTTANDSFPIMAVPFFILAGLIMGRGGISRRLFALANSLLGHIPGGVGMAAVLTAMFFSAISGSGPATVAAVGGIMIPEMVKVGYSRRFSAALIAAAGTIGVVIPPSIPLVIFGVVTGTSIGDLFLAAALPGVLMGLVLMAWAVVHARRNGISSGNSATGRERLAALNDAKWGLLLPIVILGGIYGGIFTPTEAAVISVVLASVLALLVYREMKLPDVLDTTISATLTTSALMFIVAAAAIFGRLLTIEEAPEALVNALSVFSDYPVIIILLVNLLLIVLGTFMETIASVTIVAPILVPVLTLTGMDPVQIGVLIVVILSFGFITPPLGVNLFIASKVAKVNTGEAVVATIPGLLLLICVGLVVSFIPAVSMVFIS
jgi:C4-dicarboxylate transporter DctM subunit